MKLSGFLFFCALTWNGMIVAQTQKQKKDDPFLWLEEREGARALAFVEAENKRTLDRLESDPRFLDFRAKIKTILADKEKLVTGFVWKDDFYNFWRDEQSPRGILRRTKYADFLNAVLNWETVLDIDALARSEGKSWVYSGLHFPDPEFPLPRGLVYLSEGGSDAHIVREFDLESKTFVTTNAMSLPEAKSRIQWLDNNHALLATNFGPGTLTESGYPRQVRLWKRGEDPMRAKILLDVDAKHVSADVARLSSKHLLVQDGIGFYDSDYYLLNRDTLKLQKVHVPTDFEIIGATDTDLIFKIRKTINSFESGSLVSLPIASAGDANAVANLELIHASASNAAIIAIQQTKDAFLIEELVDVKSRILIAQRSNGVWSKSTYQTALPDGDVSIIASEYRSDFMFVHQSFLEPSALFYTAGTGQAPTLVQKLAAKFQSNGLESVQKFAISKDGTRVPYFMVGRKNALKNGPRPTLLYGYGGFEISQVPSYGATLGKLWLEEGGVYVLANIRGGGEYGPRWHQAALLENRQRAYDDFIAIAEDLIRSGVTTPQKLGIMGGSNGGLLTGVAMTQRPDLFNAVVSQIPLLDMLRYTELPAGASWIAEYGDPKDPKMHEILKAYSPYHNVNPNRSYPEAFFVTSTKDDRVHPGHARKMAARLAECQKNFLFHERREGGHSGGADLEQIAGNQALTYVYLHQKLF